MQEIPGGNGVRISEVRNDRARGTRVDVAVRNQASLLPGREVASRQQQRVSLSRICATRRRTYSRLLSSLVTTIFSPRSLSGPLSLKGKRYRTKNGRRVEQRKSTRGENSRKDWKTRADREKRAEDNITSGTSHKTIQDSLQARQCLQTLQTSSSLRRNTQTSDLPEPSLSPSLLSFSLSPPIHFHLFPQRLSVIAFKLFEKPS